jgi:hypothetical protein
METPKTSYSSTYIHKFVTCLLALVAVAYLFFFLLQSLPRQVLLTLNLQYILYFFIAAILFISTALSVLWKETEEKENSKSGMWQAYLLAIIRYWLAFTISLYGFAKIFKTQFTTADFIKDMPMGEASGFLLTWFYYGHSYTLAVIIALMQIGGSILLLFRRTTLLGTMVLLPVMTNIVLINMFYQIDAGAFVVSVVLTLGLTYLLLLDYEKLKAVFWVFNDKLPSIQAGGTWSKLLIRLLPIVAAFGVIYTVVVRDTSDKKLLGTWRVAKFIRNGSLLPADAWLNDSTVITKVYFSGHYGCALSTNPFVYNARQSLQGQYNFDDKAGELQFMYYSGNSYPDTMRARVSGLTPHSMNIEAILKSDTLRMELVKVDRPSN